MQQIPAQQQPRSTTTAAHPRRHCRCSSRLHAVPQRKLAAPPGLPSGQQVDTASQAQLQQQTQQLERSYQQHAASASPPPRQAAPSSKLRPLYIRSALPVLRTIRFTERRLEADLATVAATVMLVVGYIIWDRGVEELLDNLLGDGPKGSVFSILFGLGLVVGVRVAGGKVSKLFSM